MRVVPPWVLRGGLTAADVHPPDFGAIRSRTVLSTRLTSDVVVLAGAVRRECGCPYGH